MKHQSLLKSLLFACLIVITAITIVLTPILTKKNTETRSRASVGDLKPITGTFIMSDTNISSEAELKSSFDEMQAFGIDTVIFLASGLLQTPCTPATPAFTEHYYFVANPYQWYLSSLRLAKSHNMKIYFGLVNSDVYYCTPFWVGTPTDTNTYMGRILDYSSRLVDQIKQTVQQQGWSWEDPEFAGFYLFEGGTANYTNSNGSDIQFYKQLSLRVKQKAPTKKILISPWMTEDITYDQAKLQFTNLLQHTSVDIIAPQDSMGTHKVTSFARDADHFRALHDAVSAFPGKEAWANIETQDDTGNGPYSPASFLRVQGQIAAAKPYVTKMITWIYQHTFIVDPLFNSPVSWTNQYKPEFAQKRKLLHDEYISTYVSTTCAPLFYCDTTNHTCGQTTAEYKANHTQCTNPAVTCEQNLATYLSGKSTGTCFTTLSTCQSGCTNPNPTATPTNIPTRTPTPTTISVSHTPTRTPTPTTRQATQTPTPTVIFTPTPTSGSLLSWFFPTISPTPTHVTSKTPTPTIKSGTASTTVSPTISPTPTAGSLLSWIMPKRNQTPTQPSEDQTDSDPTITEETKPYEPELKMTESMLPSQEQSATCRFFSSIPILGVVAQLFCK